MHVANYLALLQNSEQQLVDALLTVATHHGDEPDIYTTCKLLASWSGTHIEALDPLIDRYAEQKSEEPEQLSTALFHEPRTGSLALLRDLHDLWLLANEVNLCWMVLSQAAKALRDQDLQAACDREGEQTQRQISWLRTRIQQAAPQLLVAS